MQNSSNIEIIVVGSTIMNFLWNAHNWPKSDETLPAEKYAFVFGGRGANQSVAATRIGARVALITNLGDDKFGQNYLEHLRTIGVNTDFVNIRKNEITGISQTTILYNGGTQTVIFSGANKLLCREDVDKARSIICEAKVLICEQEVPNDVALYTLSKFKGVSILNATPRYLENAVELLKASSIVCCNGEEAAYLIGKDKLTTPTECIAALEHLIKVGAKAAIISLGPIGSVYANNEMPIRCIHVPVHNIKHVVCGFTDNFIGAFAYLIARFPEFPIHQQIGGANDFAGHLNNIISMEANDTPQILSINKRLDLNINLNKKCYAWQTMTSD